MTAQKGKHVKLGQSATVAAGAIMVIGLVTPAVADADAKGFATHSLGSSPAT
jgi:hypothetical protein